MTTGTWADYFPFESDEDLKIEARILMFSLKGGGKVIARSDSELNVAFSIPEQSILGKSIPAIDVAIQITYSGEGGGNAAVIEYNGKRKHDQALVIASNLKEGERRMDPSVAIGGKTVGFTMVRSGKRSAEVRDITGINLPFELKLKIKPA